MKFWSLQLVKDKELKKQIEIEANLECQLFLDPEETMRLNFTPPPPLPSHYRKIEKVPLTAGIYNLVRNILHELKP